MCRHVDLDQFGRHDKNLPKNLHKLDDEEGNGVEDGHVSHALLVYVRSDLPYLNMCNHVCLDQTSS